MEEIYVVIIDADYYEDEETGKRVAYSQEERRWEDSFWTTEEAALAEAERLWYEDEYEYFRRVVVLRRRINKPGPGVRPHFRIGDRLVKCWGWD